MNPQGPTQLRGYPDPSASDQLVNATTYFNPRPTQQSPLSHEDQNLAASLSNANSLSNDMNGHLGALPPQLGAEHSPNFHVGGQNSLPHTPHQTQMSAPITGPHAGVEPNQDLSYNTGSNSRKRSKTSRACDECRKTKIRCDAATSTSDGNVVQKCTNCTRKSLECKFSRAPLKRGPSKGYIKELAERVQQVESHVGIPGASFRQSIDAGSPPDAYPDQHSPEETTLSGSRKRTHSQFESNIFTQSPHNRSSLGGYSLGQPAQRLSRTRDSIALAPDQKVTDIAPLQVTELTTAAMSLPFWRDWVINTTDASQAVPEDGPAVGDTWGGDDLFKSYLDQVHHELSILPKSYENVRHYVKRCSPMQAAALSYVLAQATGSNLPDAIFPNEMKFEDYVWDKARGFSLTRGKASNVVWFWILTFMLLNADNDLARLVGAGKLIPKAVIANLAIYLSQQIQPTHDLSVNEIETGFESEYITVARTYHSMAILVRLFNIGSGQADQLRAPNTIFSKLNTETKLTFSSPKTAFLTSLSKVFALLTSIGTRTYDRMPESEITEQYNDALMDGIDATCREFSDWTLTGLMDKVKLFVDLLLARKNIDFDPAGIRTLAQELADYLCRGSITSLDHHSSLMKPLEIHFYVVTAYTLLEMMDNDYEASSAAAEQSLAKLQTPLEQILELATARSLARGLQTEFGPRLHWAEALLGQIETRRQAYHKQAVIQGTTDLLSDQDPATNGNAEKTVRKTMLVSLRQYRQFADDPPTPTTNASTNPEGRSYKLFNFALLTHHGYLKVLAAGYDLNSAPTDVA